MTEPNGATAPGAPAASTPVTGAQLAPNQPSEQHVEASLIADLDRLFGDPAAVSAAEETTTDLSNQAGGAEAHETPAQTDSGTDTETDPEATTEGAEPEAEAEPEADDEPKTVPYRRLAKEIAKRKALEERLEALEAKVQTKEPEAPAAETPDDPELKPHRERASKADAELKAARDLKALLKTNPDAVAEQIRKVDPRVGADEESLREWLNDYADAQRDKLAEAKATLAAAEQTAVQRRQQMETTARAEARQQVETVAPWVKTSAEVLNQLREAEADEDTATVAQLRRKLDPRWNRFAQYMGTPEIKRHPLGLKVAVALAEIDHRLELARKPAASASAKPAAV